jgi:hypothetical protein
MKRSTLFLIIFALFNITQLGYSQDSSRVDKKAEFEEKVKKAETYKVENGLGIVIIGYTSLDEDVGYNGFHFSHDTGKYDVVVKVFLLNTSDEIIIVNPLHFKAVTNNGYTLSIEDYTFNTKAPFTTTELEPRTKTSGFLVFGLNESDDKIKLIIYDDMLGHRVSRNYDDAKTLEIQRILIEYNLNPKK